MARPAGLTKTPDPLAPFLAQLRALPFVCKAKPLKLEVREDSKRFDALIRVTTDAGEYEYVAEVKSSYLDLAVTRAILALAKEFVREGKRLLLLARYVPQPTAQQLIQAGVDFIDLAGNANIRMKPHYYWTVVGNRERAEQAERGHKTPQTAATLQVVFTIAAHPEAGTWTVRELAAAAGVSKSKAANTRRELLEKGVIRQAGGRFRSADPQDLIDQLLSGYRQVLRPRLVIGRFRPQERDVQEFLARLQKAASTSTRFRYSLTGGPAAYLLQRMYRGRHAPVFVEAAAEDTPKRLRLLPDRNGPVTLLKAFGDMVYWRTVNGTSLADPWLIYAELMTEPDARAHEAAEELRKEFLSQ